MLKDVNRNVRGLFLGRDAPNYQNGTHLLYPVAEITAGFGGSAVFPGLCPCGRDNDVKRQSESRI